MTHNQVAPSFYRYNRAMIVLATVIALLSALFDLYFLYFFAERRDGIGMVIMIFLSVFPVLLSRAILSRASIVVDGTGISANALGIRTKAITWENIKKIRKARVTNGYAYVDSFHIEDIDQHGVLCRFFVNFCGSIVFNQDIRGLRNLLNQINLYAREHEIPLVVWDTEAAAAKLVSDKGPGYWKRASAQIPEVSVAEF